MYSELSDGYDISSPSVPWAYMGFILACYTSQVPLTLDSGLGQRLCPCPGFVNLGWVSNRNPVADLAAMPSML